MSYPPDQIYLWDLRLVVPDAKEFDYEVLIGAVDRLRPEIRITYTEGKIFADVVLRRHVNERPDRFIEEIGEAVQILHQALMQAYKNPPSNL